MPDEPLVTPPATPAASTSGAPAVDTPKVEVPVVKTELGEAPKLDEQKLGPDGKPIETKPAEAPAPFDATKLSFPEGFKPDEKLTGDFAALMNDDKLPPQERGQKLLDLYHGAIKQVGEANTKAWTDLNGEWVKQAKADAEIGGAKFETTKTTISRVIDSLGTAQAAAFRQALDITGAGNNPAIIKGLAKMAQLLTEGGHVQGSPPSKGDGKSFDAKSFFPNSPGMTGAPKES
jgi:hypothetical protein